MNKRALGLLLAVGAAVVACGGGGGGGGGGGSGATGGGGDGGSGGGQTDCNPGDTQGCFDDDPSLAGVGICVEGTQTCRDDGSWGACEDQVLPEAEDCGATGDEDCDGFACSEPNWSVQLGASGAIFTRDLVSDADGASYLVGNYNASIAPGGQSHTSAGGTDIFVVKVSADGEILWSRSFGSSANEQVDAAAIDQDGHLVIAGSTTGDTLDFGGGAIIRAGTREIFLAKLDADGAHVMSRYGTTHVGDDTLWTQDPTGEKYVRDLVVMDDGSIITVGYYTGDWGCTGSPQCTPVNPTVDVGAYVQKYDANLVPVWRDTYDGPGFDEATVVARTGPDEVIWAGIHQGPILISAVTYPDPGAFVVGTNSESINGFVDTVDAVTFIRNISPTSDGGVLIAMSFNGNTTLKGDAITSDGVDGAVLRYDGDGTLTSYFHPGGSGNDEINDAAETDGAEIVVTGRYEGGIDLGGGAMPTPPSTQAMFLASAEADGYAHRWSKTAPGSSANVSRLISLLPNGHVVIAGEFSSGTADFGTGALDTSGFDAFIASFQP